MVFTKAKKVEREKRLNKRKVPDFSAPLEYENKSKITHAVFKKF